MFIVDHVKPEEAQGIVADIYAMFPKEIGVPAPMQLLSVSPGLLKLQARSIRYFMGHDRLEAPLLPALRYLGASRAGYEYCMGLNAGMLEAQGMDRAELGTITEDPASAPLEPGEVAMLQFVAKALDSPEAVTREDVELLTAKGWTQADILDALMHASQMIAFATVFKALSS